uniref:zinc finger FYVE domain-containing protein 26 n=1 Tax=Myxine glutinosa TaxID=7769 RepID=UPI00358E2D5C
MEMPLQSEVQLIDRSAQHPFCGEALASARQLPGFIHRRLHAGHWELARTILAQLRPWQQELGVNIHAVLVALTTSPDVIQNTSTLPAACLAWLCICEHEGQQEEEEPQRLQGSSCKSLRQIVGLRLLLQLHDPIVTDAAAEDLYRCIRDNHEEQGADHVSSKLKFSDQTAHFLRLLLQESPRRAAYLAQLCYESHWDAQSYCGRRFHALFVNIVRKSLHDFRTAIEHEETLAQAQDRVYKSLAAFAFTLPAGSEEAPPGTRDMLQELGLGCCAASPHLTEGRVLGSLMCSGGPALAKLYYSLLDVKEKDSLLEELHKSQAFSSLSEGEKMALALFSPQRYAWRSTFFYCLHSNSHFLQMLLDASLQLVHDKQLHTLRELLSGPFIYLRRLVLLLAWPECRSFFFANDLLEALHNGQSVMGDQCLVEACNTLKSQLDVLHWCLENSGHYQREEQLAVQLPILDRSSPLLLLSTFTELQWQDEESVLKLLSRPISSTHCHKKNATCMQQSSQLLFHAFCAMKHAVLAMPGGLCVGCGACTREGSACIGEMEALSSHRNNRNITNDFQSSDGEVAFKSEMGILGNPPPSCGRAAAVRSRLRLCQVHLQMVVSATLRLEVLENLFSLLFVTGSDLMADMPDMDTEDEYAEENTSERVANESLESSVDCLGASPSYICHILHHEQPPEQPRTCHDLSKDSNKPHQAKPHHPTDTRKETLLPGGFLADEDFTEQLLKLITDSLAELHSNTFSTQNYTELFRNRLARLTHYTSEAQWRFKLVCTMQILTGVSKATHSMKRRWRKRHRRPRILKEVVEMKGKVDAGNGESPSTTEGSSGGYESVCGTHGVGESGPRIPSHVTSLMLTPPDGLLAACIMKNNYAQAHQVVRVFGLEEHATCLELYFMEEYGKAMKELQELDRNEVSVKPGDNMSVDLNKSPAGQDVLLGIARAAAAGVTTLSISGIVERLSTFVPAQFEIGEEDEECKTTARCAEGRAENVVHQHLANVHPTAALTCDLACSASVSWRSSRALLELIEKKQLDCHGNCRSGRTECKRAGSIGLLGFPAFVEELTKLLNYRHPQGKNDIGEDLSGCLNCGATELLLYVPGPLEADQVVTKLAADKRYQIVVARLQETLTGVATEGNGFTCKLPGEHDRAKMEARTSTTRHLMKQLLKAADHQRKLQSLSNPGPDYLRCLFDSVNKMATVSLRCHKPEADGTGIKPTNSLVMLQQKPVDIFCQLLFDEQIPPKRLERFMQEPEEPSSLSLLHVIVESCCEPLPLWSSFCNQAHVYFVSAAAEILQDPLARQLPELSNVLSMVKNILPKMPPGVNQRCAGPLAGLTSSTLSYLKDKNLVLAALACLSTHPPSFPTPGGRCDKKRSRENPLDTKQLDQEFQRLLHELPTFCRLLKIMATILHDVTDDCETGSSGVGTEPWQHTRGAALLLCALHSEEGVKQACASLRVAVDAQRWNRACKIVEVFSGNHASLPQLRDCLLCCAAAAGSEGWRYLLRVSNRDLRARVALARLRRWPLNACLDILELCLAEPCSEQHLAASILNSYNELCTYQKILDLGLLENCTEWTHVVSELDRQPQVVLDGLLDAKEFAVCRDWLRICGAGTDLQSRVEEKQLTWLIEQEKEEEAEQLLQTLTTPEERLNISSKLLQQSVSVLAQRFLANYLVMNFADALTPDELQQMHTLCFGAQIACVLPRAAWSTYQGLCCQPLLLFEQLLMNMRVEWAAQALQVFHSRLSSDRVDVSIHDMDHLLSKYAGHALDFPYAPHKNALSVSEDSNLTDELPSFGTAPSEQTSQSSGSNNQEEPEAYSVSQSPSISTEAQLKQMTLHLGFEPPQAVPARDEWAPDTAADVCMSCEHERFSMFNRRHHCRRCGRVVCGSCSMHKMEVEGYGTLHVRVCQHCYQYFANKESISDENHDQDQSANGLDYTLPQELLSPELSKPQWQLSLDTSHNQHLREEFSFEQAPNASLCLVLLKLHSNSAECGHQLAVHCVALSHTLNSPEVDRKLVISIMKKLLFNAKMMFVEASLSQDLSLCDSYLSFVAVLRILVLAGYRHLPTLDQMVLPGAVTRLRDRLIEDEHYQLAIEVSTKSGLDRGGVWSAWGMACLNAGFFAEAWEKFSRCLQPPLDRNQLTYGSQILQEIVHNLEGCSSSQIQSTGEDPLASLWELQGLLHVDGGHSQDTGDRASQDRLYDECLRYLHQYGTHLAFLSFLARHKQLRQAAQHTLDKDCAEEVFVEGLLLPALQAGRLDDLLQHLFELDPLLQSWSSILVASCKHLNRRGLHHSLLHLQRFMKDDIRAAMTCIRFFRRGAISYADLFRRLPHLEEAKTHLKAALSEPQAWPSTVFGQHHKAVHGVTQNANAPFLLKISPTDLTKNISTIDLQVEVTKFLKQYETLSESSSMAPHTLFGNNNVKCDVACKVILSGVNVEEGFGIAFRILQEFELPALAVYVRVARQLVERAQGSELQRLLRCVAESGMAGPGDLDTVVLSAVRTAVVASPATLEVKELDSLIAKMKNDNDKVKAYMVSGRLRSAYLVAVKLQLSESVPFVEIIMAQAQRLGQQNMTSMCKRWLVGHRHDQDYQS